MEVKKDLERLVEVFEQREDEESEVTYVVQVKKTKSLVEELKWDGI